jgi:hypothetical protein
MTQTLERIEMRRELEIDERQSAAWEKYLVPARAGEEYRIIFDSERIPDPNSRQRPMIAASSTDSIPEAHR